VIDEKLRDLIFEYELGERSPVWPGLMEHSRAAHRHGKHPFMPCLPPPKG
jgi:hypothetical protein